MNIIFLIFFSLNERYASLGLKELKVQATLGIGGFGRVELVTLGEDKTHSFALKVMKKAQIVETRQQQHILNEKQIMLESNCAFIVKLYKTFKGFIVFLIMFVKVKMFFFLSKRHEISLHVDGGVPRR